MYSFSERDDGLFVEHENGRGVAHVDTKTVGETNDPNLKVQKRVVTDIPHDKWLIHFTGYKFTPAEIGAFCQELAAQ